MHQTTQTTDQLAETIRTALATQNPYGAVAAICMLWDDSIEVVHRPAIALDGPHEVGEAYRAWAHEWFLLGRAITGFTMGGTAERDGDRIAVEYAIGGTLRDGSPVRATLNVRYTVADGRIVKTESLGGDGGESLGRALMDAGMSIGGEAATT